MLLPVKKQARVAGEALSTRINGRVVGSDNPKNGHINTAAMQEATDL